MKTTMKSPLEFPKEIRMMTWYIPRRVQTHPRSQIQATRRIPVRYPQMEKLLLLQGPEPTPRRRKVSCFPRNTWTSWWPRSGPRSIKRSNKLCLITKQVRRPVSRVTRKTMRRHRIPRQKTKTMVITYFKDPFA